ncbi:soluble lytic murein transglycosylase-like protein [Methylohalomonas lacus]|uniref:Soluble lytic murein transglycosylase-like protein n=1 Tax=Methylohalomonas lacus TaxID=398773 RepID=A0AAE3HJ93_9GAMM|nr:transglycosylase SLT domain-containing protein [Methylohalomonas lacus]MCS3902870.1 soluble lytic murein transglycosylase-like protein [Methylohalomonas lacus]
MNAYFFRGLWFKSMLVGGLLAVLLAVPAAQADIYKYVDKHGRVYLTDKPKHSGYKRLVKTWKGWQEPSYDTSRFKQNQRRFADLITEAAEQYVLPDSLVHAVVTAESAYDPNALSSAGALGLMQLMPATAKRFGVSDRKNPRANVYAGTRYLKQLLGMFDNDVRLALAAYNAGENAVIKYDNQIPPYPETQNYVRKVLKYYRQYREQGIQVAGN